MRTSNPGSPGLAEAEPAPIVAASPDRAPAPGLTDAADRFAAPVRHGLTRPGGVLGGGYPGYGLYETALLGILDDAADWLVLLRLPHLLARPVGHVVVVARMRQ